MLNGINKTMIAMQLTKYGIPADVAMQGPDAVKKYASEKGISLPPPPEPSIFEAKDSRPAPKPPEPKPPVAELLALGIPYDTIMQGPDAVKAYADKNNITLPPPPQKPQGLSISA